MELKIHSISLIILIFLITYFVSSFNGRCDIDTMKCGKSYLLFLCTGIFTSFALLAICSSINMQNFRIKNILKNICNGAALIVGLNMLAINVFKPVMLHFVKQWNSIYGLVLGFIIILTFYPLIIFTKRYIPIIIGNRK